jgi:hypothetical protein
MTAIIGNSLERRLCFVDVGHQTIKPEHGGIGIRYHRGDWTVDLVRLPHLNSHMERTGTATGEGNPPFWHVRSRRSNF